MACGATERIRNEDGQLIGFLGADGFNPLPGCEDQTPEVFRKAAKSGQLAVEHAAEPVETDATTAPGCIV